MRNTTLTLLALAMLPSLVSAEEPFKADYSEVLSTDADGFQVVRLNADGLALRRRLSPLSFGNNADCVMLDNNGQEVFHVPFPFEEDFIKEVKAQVVANGGYPITMGRMRAVMKQEEVAKKDYDLGDTVPESDWDY